MKLYNDEQELVGILSGYSDRCITTELENGDKELSFEYPSKGELTGALKEECYIRTEEDEFVLKEVERDTEKCRYTAVLNIEELEGKSFPGGFDTVEKTVEECLKAAFEGTGWTVESSVKKRRTIREQDAPSAWDILKKVLSTYRCECSIDSIGKSVNIEERIGEDRGSYFIEGLNLKKLTPKSDTYDFYTRIYPVGKDGITPESVTGKAYIDNFQYSRKVKAITWKDERYTDVQSLIEDATAKLEEMSKPYIEMQADVADLARCSDRYGILDYNIGDTVTIVSPGTNTRDKQRIVKIVKYPESPEKNTVDIANAKKTFAQVQKEEVDSETERASAEEDSLGEDIAEESSTREEEDGKLNVRLEKTEGSIEAEVSRATGAESGLSSRLTIAEDGISAEVSNRQNADSEMSSRITQTAEQIQTEVSNRQNADSEMSTKISQTAHRISVSASGGDNSVGIIIQLYDENGNLIDIDSGNANINIVGFVSFSDLAGEGTTTINGANITTGNISCDRLSGGTIYGQKIVLDNSWSLLTDDYGNNIFSILSSWKRTNSLASTSNGNDWFGVQSFNSQATLRGDISAPGVKNRTSTAVANVRCQDGTNSWLAIASSSSMRYKHDITEIVDAKLDPHRLYQLPPRQYKYNFDYINTGDQRYNTDVCGFIAEEMNNVYPIACEYNENGEPENWNERYVIPPMLALIQEQHEEIESLKQENLALQNRLSILEQKMEEIENVINNKNN